jgi:hypothetical protein
MHAWHEQHTYNFLEEEEGGAQTRLLHGFINNNMEIALYLVVY